MPLLEGFVERRASVLVTGGTGAGKTTLLKAMLMRCAPGERVITVEEVRELGMLNHANHVSLVTRDANMEGKGAIGLSAADMCDVAYAAGPRCGGRMPWR